MGWLEILERLTGTGGIVSWHGIGPAPHLRSMHATPGHFARQLDCIAEHFTVLPLPELVERVASGKSLRGLVSLTFDDAYAGLVEHAYPRLREHKVPSTIFVTSEATRAASSFWWDDIELADDAALASIREQLGTLPAGTDPRTFVLGRHAGRRPWKYETAPAPSPWRAQTWDQLRAAAAADPGLAFGVHTITHPALPRLSQPEQVSEMTRNHEELQRELPRIQPIIAYPYGLYDEGTVTAAQGAGMTAGVTMEGRAPGRGHHRYMIPRVGLGEAHSLRSLRLRLTQAARPMIVYRNRGAHPKIPVA